MRSGARIFLRQAMTLRAVILPVRGLSSVGTLAMRMLKLALSATTSISWVREGWPSGAWWALALHRQPC